MNSLDEYSIFVERLRKSSLYFTQFCSPFPKKEQKREKYRLPCGAPYFLRGGGYRYFFRG
jgi:hypothetical protein